MSSATHLKSNNFENMQEVRLSEDASYQRVEDPLFPPLAVIESPHSSLNEGEQSYYFKDPASYAIAVVGLAALDRLFRVHPPNEEGVARIDVEKSFVTMDAVNTVGHYTLAESLMLKWNSTTDEEAISQIRDRATLHADAIQSLGTITINGEQGFANLTENEFRITA